MIIVFIYVNSKWHVPSTAIVFLFRFSGFGILDNGPRGYGGQRIVLVKVLNITQPMVLQKLWQLVVE